ncbi:ESCRT-II complex subunit [Echria macrotheca]|uniref:Vacuolar protein-sorting-associated protein 25 n=1 Tax=Echria macrotheca TaxID=438768 RepID=A0AAJ0BCE1_9PEZI|nr:ESCRT-II complex subunit [Echria macrotheca]
MQSQTTTTTTPPPFQFPREYSFPPFFTRQHNLTTHHAQLTKWASLVLSYCRHHRLYKLTLSDSSASQFPLFYNAKINRRLGISDIREVVEFLRRDGRAEWVGGSDSNNKEDGGEGGDVVWIYWRTPEEWAAVIEGWVESTAQRGSVLTLYELREGDGARGAEFHGIEPELLQKALGVLVKRGKAQIFGNEDSQGVKFF